jgi:hypothetical protein
MKSNCIKLLALSIGLSTLSTHASKTAETLHTFLQQPIEAHELTKIKVDCFGLEKYSPAITKFTYCPIYVDQQGTKWYINDRGDIGINYIYSHLIEAIAKGTELEGYTPHIRFYINDDGRVFKASKYIPTFRPFFDNEHMPTGADLWDQFEKGTVHPIGTAMESAIAQFLRIQDRHAWNHGWLVVDDKAISITIDLDHSTLPGYMGRERQGQKCYYAAVDQTTPSKKKGYVGYYSNNVSEYPLEVVAHIANLDINHLCSVVSNAIYDIAHLQNTGYKGSYTSDTIQKWASQMIQNLRDIHQQWNYYYQVRLAEEQLQDKQAVKDFIKQNPALQNWSPYDINCNYLAEYAKTE